jgi:hypothetical protein
MLIIELTSIRKSFALCPVDAKTQRFVKFDRRSLGCNNSELDSQQITVSLGTA